MSDNVHEANNKHAKVINLVAQYIYDRSDEVISLEQLATYTGFSKYHFNRLFFAATGYQLGAFVQRLKLEKALNLIKQGNHSIIDVALSVGYDSPSSFSRVFRQCFSVSPKQVILGNFPVNERAVDFRGKKTPSNQNIKPVWKRLPEQRIFGLYGRGFSQQSFSTLASQLYGKLIPLVEEQSHSELHPVGVSIDNPWAGEHAESRFFAGFVKGLSVHHESLEFFTWEGGRWACFIHVGPYDSMWQTISQIYTQWVLPNDIKLKDHYIVQRYLNNPKDTKPEELKTELYFAVAESAVTEKFETLI